MIKKRGFTPFSILTAASSFSFLVPRHLIKSARKTLPKKPSSISSWSKMLKMRKTGNQRAC